MSDKKIEEMDAIELIIAAEAAGSTGLDMSPGDPLAAACARMMKALVRDIWRKDQGPSFWFTVVRINDHPMTRGLYPPALWIYRELDGRDRANAKKKELVLIAREGWRLPDDGE